MSWHSPVEAAASAGTVQNPGQHWPVHAVPGMAIARCRRRQYQSSTKGSREDGRMTSPRQMRLGLSMRYHGYHHAGWRLPEVPAAGTLDYRYFVNTARLAEAAKFDMVFLADGIGIRVRDEPPGSFCRSPQTVDLEPLTLYGAIAA